MANLGLSPTWSICSSEFALWSLTHQTLKYLLQEILLEKITSGSSQVKKSENQKIDKMSIIVRPIMKKDEEIIFEIWKEGILGQI